MKVALLFSGGKDSTYATWLVQHQGWEVTALVTVRPRSSDSLMFHHPNVEWTHLQAEAMGIPSITIQALERDELVELHRHLMLLKTEQRISGVVTGAVASDYQKTRFDNICDDLGLKTFAPLWHKNARLLVEDLKRAGFRIIVTAVAAKGLDESWLGRELSDPDWSMLERLSEKHGIHLTGEGGEYESFVIDAPHFRKRIWIDKTRSEWDRDNGRLIIEATSLRDKLGN